MADPAHHPILRVAGVSKAFGGIVVADNVNLTIDKGEILVSLDATFSGADERSVRKQLVSSVAEVRRRFRATPGELRRSLTVLPEARWIEEPAHLEFIRSETTDHYADHVADLQLHSRRHPVGIAVVERDRHQDVHELGREECRHLGVFAGIGRAPIRSKGVSR